VKNLVVIEESCYTDHRSVDCDEPHALLGGDAWVDQVSNQVKQEVSIGNNQPLTYKSEKCREDIVVAKSAPY